MTVARRALGMLLRSLHSRCLEQKSALKLTYNPIGSVRLSSPDWCRPSRLRTAHGSGHAAVVGPSLACSLPLAERKSRVSVPQKDVLEWYDAQVQRLHQVGNSFAETDGPSREDLQRELEWLLDDTVAGHEDGPGSWRELKQRYRLAPGRQDATANLRLTLDTLGQLWHQRLHDRVPLQYLTCSAHWRDLVIAVGPGVLIPRPETELMVDFAVEAMSQTPALAEGIWADMGTGSGALAIGLAKCMRAGGQVWAVDVSAEAAAWARLNVMRTGVEERVKVAVGSWFTPLQELRGRLSGILSNPPYIPSNLVPGLQAEVAQHEPWLALDGGEGGEIQLIHICHEAADMLAPGGFLALETHGGMQAEAVFEYLSRLQGVHDAPAFTSIQMLDDMYGIRRFVTASRL